MLRLHFPQQPAGSAGVVSNKVYAGAVRAAPPRAQFYGHNPNLKLPPDLFLLGCVFHIVSITFPYNVVKLDEHGYRQGY